jgi:hypothetical protein
MGLISFIARFRGFVSLAFDSVIRPEEKVSSRSRSKIEGLSIASVQRQRQLPVATRDVSFALYTQIQQVLQRSDSEDRTSMTTPTG